MKVLTVKQPWASLIALGYKEYEFRSWQTKYRGELLIHAGKGIDKPAMERFKDLNINYEYGKIIAKVKLVDCIKTNKALDEELLKKNKLVYGVTVNRDGYAWKLEDVEEYDGEYINGKLSLWEL